MHNRMPVLIVFTIACVLVFALFFLKNTHRQITEAHHNGLESIVNTCHANAIRPAASGNLLL